MKLFRMDLNKKNMETDIRQRIKMFLNSKKITNRTLANLIGVSEKTLNNKLNGTRGLDLDTVQSIILHFEELSSDWLLTNEGPMLKSTPTSTQHIQNRDGIVAGGSMIVPSHYAAQKIAEKKEGKLLEVKAELAGLKQENERLREEIDRLRAEILKFNERTEGAYRENETLKKENSELHKQLLESKDRLISMLMERK